MPVGKPDRETQELINVLVACARECRHCALACQEDDRAASLEACVRLSQDCADLCALEADLLRRSSIFRARLRRLCAEACGACADACARHPSLDQCRECFEACRRCAETCRNEVPAIA